MTTPDNPGPLQSLMRIGQLAERAGVTIRTLRYYEELELIEPARWTMAGQRRYGEAEALTIQRIRSLVQLGFSLKEVKQCLDDPRFSAEKVLRQHLEKLEDVIAENHRLRERLVALVEQASSSEPLSSARLLSALEEINRLEKYFTAEQRTQLRRRASEIGPRAHEDAQSSWASLIRDLKEQINRGADPLDPSVRALAVRWKQLVDAFTGLDQGIEMGAGRVWQNEGQRLADDHTDCVPTPEMFSFISPALGALRQDKNSSDPGSTQGAT